MKAGLPFVALLHALSRKTQVAAGASSSAQLLEGAARSERAVRPSAASARWHLLQQRKMSALVQASLALIEAPSFRLVQARRSCGLVCFAIQMQGTVSRFRAWPNPSFKRTCLRQAA